MASTDGHRRTDSGSLNRPGGKWLCAPERLAGLVGEVAPACSDVMEILLGKASQFGSPLGALAPSVQHIGDRGERVMDEIMMMICHHIGCTSRHDSLLKQISSC